MSDPMGQGTTPEKSTYSGPGGYASSKLSVKGLGSAAYEPIENNASGTTKGSVGSFAPRQNQPPIKGSIESATFFGRPAKPRYGNEVRSPLAEQLENKRVSEKVLKQLVQHSSEFAATRKEFETLDGQGVIKDLGNRSVVTTLIDEAAIAISLTGSSPTLEHLQAVEDALEALRPRMEKIRKEAEAASARKLEAESKAELQQEILNLSFDVDTVLREARAIEGEIGDDEIRREFRIATARIEVQFAELKRRPEKKTKNNFDTSFNEYKESLEIIKKDFIKKSTPAVAPSVTPAPATAPTSPGTAPAQEPLREYGGWPAAFEVFYRKQTKNLPDGWFFKGEQNTPISEEDAAEWDAERKAFGDVYKRYIAFIKNLRTSDKNQARSLFDAKNAVVKAVREKDLSLVSVRREEFEKELESWEGRWTKLKELKDMEKTLDEAKNTASKVESATENDAELRNLIAKKEEAVQAVDKTRQAILGGSEYDLAKVGSLIEKYKKTVEVYKTTQEKVGRNILRPIRANDKNRNQKIRLIDGRETTVGEYATELEQKRGIENFVTITENILKEWPELRSVGGTDGAGYLEGDRVDRETFNKLEKAIKYGRMLRRNENAFLALYVNPFVDPDTQEVVYASTENLRKHPDREIIKELLLGMKNMHVIDPSREEIRAEEAKSKENEHLQRTRLGMTYNPTRDLENVTTLRKSMPKETKTRISNFGGMVTNEKRKPVKMAESFGYRPDKEEEILSQEDKERRQEALRRVNDIMTIRNKWFDRSPKKEDNKERLRFWFTVGSVVLVAATAAGMGAYLTKNNKGVREELGPIATATNPPALEAAVQGNEKLPDWKEWFLDKQFISDFIAMSPENLAMKYAPQSADPNKPAAVSDVMKMDGDVVLNNPDTCYGLDDDKRSELCNFLRNIEKISQAVDAPEQEAARKNGKLFMTPSDWYFGRGVTIEEGIRKIKAKIVQAENRNDA